MMMIMTIRDDVTLGISLMAPHVRYPDHQHPPEEIYVSLASGAGWRMGGARTRQTGLQ
jgi:Dimethlysulfonioproprionate lyase